MPVELVPVLVLLSMVVGGLVGYQAGYGSGRLAMWEEMEMKRLDRALQQNEEDD